MLRGSSDSEEESNGGEDARSVELSGEGFRPAQLRMPEEVAMAEILANQMAQQQVLQAGMQQQAQQLGRQLEIAKLQAATSLDLRKDIASIDKFTGETGDLNHFLRSGDGVSARITARVECWQAGCAGCRIAEGSIGQMSPARDIESTPGG